MSWTQHFAYIFRKRSNMSDFPWQMYLSRNCPQASSLGIFSALIQKNVYSDEDGS